MKTCDLIHDLAQQGHPIRPTPRCIVRFTWWAAISVLCVTVGIVHGVRSDLSAELQSGLFISQAALAFGLAVTSASSALHLSVPGRANRLHTLIPACLLLAGAVLLIGPLLFAGHVDPGPGLHCARNVVALTLIPCFLLYVILRAAAPLRSSLVGFLAALAASSLGYVATRFVCHVDDPLHVFVWHYLPVLGLSVLGGILGRTAFRANR